MPIDKKADLDKQAWAWTSTTIPDVITRSHLESAYRIGPSVKKCKNCKKNCMSNPKCLTGLGEEYYIKSAPYQVATLESSLRDLRDPSEYVGLMNLGATCYVNSLIQVWFHNEDMRKIIFKWNIENDPDEKHKMYLAEKENEPYSPGTAVGQLQYIFAMMQFGNHKFLDPINLASALGLDLTTQQDAQEFSKLLLCHIEGKFHQNSDLTNMLRKLTQGQYSYINRCSACGTEHKTSTTFYELDLQLAPTLGEAIDKYLVEEQLTGLNQYHCRVCNSKQDATRFIRLDSLPDTLNIQLLRFVFQRLAGCKKKLSTSIQFPEKLDMSPYLNCPPETHVFTLVAALNHKGRSAHSGHFSANIRNSNGEWFEFSDDKIERMQSNRIEDDTIHENGKGKKRDRVPKGFFSSNTAYTLVYKRTTNLPENNKKAMIKKFSTPTSNHVIDLQNPSVTLTRDSVNIAIKGKRLLKESCVDGDVQVFEKKTKIESGDSNGKHRICNKENSNNMSNDITQNDINSHENCKIDFKKEPIEKMDFMMMSCGLRDAYEDSEFEKWGLSQKMRYLVRRDNEAHELSLLAQQQGKQKELEEQNEKRLLVIKFYEMISGNSLPEEFRWIPTDWLLNWLKGTRKIERDSPKKIPPIDCSSLMCPHEKLDPLKANKVKCVPPAAAQLLYSKYGAVNELTENSLCDLCVKKQCRKLRFKKSLEQDSKEVAEILKNLKHMTIIDGYIVGAESLRFWKNMAMKDFLSEIDQLPAEDTDDESFDFNKDLLCEHDSLRVLDSKRKVIPAEVWMKLKTYFPNCTEYPSTTPACSICEENLKLEKKTQEFDKVNAKKQKDELIDLYYEKNRPKILESLKPGETCYIIEREFLDVWRSFIRYAENFHKPAPTKIMNSKLLCQPHESFLFQLQTSSCKDYGIVSSEEWQKLLSFYDTDKEIKIVRSEETNELEVIPGTCEGCMFERLQQEQEKNFKFEKGTIYIKRLEDNEETPRNTEERDPLSTVATRPARRGRKVKGSHELQVSSEITLKELKIMTMNIYKAGPYDQHVILGDHELTDDEQTLSTLGISPGCLLHLKIDMPLENSENEDEMNQDYTSPEKGFKGTELAG